MGKQAIKKQEQNGKKGARKAAVEAGPAATKRARFEASPAKATTSKKQQQQPSTGVQKGKNTGKKAAAAPPPEKTSTPAAPSTFVVSVGSYERLLYGLSCTFTPTPPTSSSNLPYELSVLPVFSFPAHLSSIRAVSASTLTSASTGSERKVGGKYLVSGGMDEIIKVWDLRRRKEVGSLEGEAAGTITCLRFVASRGMLLAASSDSTITLYRVRDWVALRSLKGHKGRVNAIDAHPAGRVAMSVGQDKMLRMWDLVAGKAVATLKIGQEGDVVKWNTDGTKFAVICGSTLTVYSIDMTVLHTLTAPSRFHDVQFCYFPIDATDPKQKEYFFVACEDGRIRVFEVGQGGGGEEEVLEPVKVLAGHTNRVKMLDLLEVAYPTSSATEEAETTLVLTSASSDGKINFYDLAALSQESEEEIKPIGCFDTDGSRLTCVCAVGMVERKGEEAKGEDEEDSSDEEEEEEDDDDDEEEELEEEDEDEEEDEEEEEEEEEEWGGVEEEEE